MHLVGFIIRKFMAMHGHMNVKYSVVFDGNQKLSVFLSVRKHNGIFSVKINLNKSQFYEVHQY
jgi:hypothetical protein